MSKLKSNYILVIYAIFVIFAIYVFCEVSLEKFFSANSKIYTDYFPGINNITKHSYFDPIFKNKKRIVIIGDSVMDGIGLDYTWSFMDFDSSVKLHNVHIWGSLSGQLQEIINHSGKSNWQVFNLAKGGARMTPLIYIYAKISELNPDIVILGIDQILYTENIADANMLNSEQYWYMNNLFNKSDVTRNTWSNYKNTLIKFGADKNIINNYLKVAANNSTEEMTSLSILDSASTLYKKIIRSYMLPQIKEELKFAKVRDWNNKSWDSDPYGKDATGKQKYNVIDDHQMLIFQAVKLISDMQHAKGAKFYFIFEPNYNLSENYKYKINITKLYERYLIENKVDYFNYQNVKFVPIYETTDGKHNTFYGTIKFANLLFNDLNRVHAF